MFEVGYNSSVREVIFFSPLDTFKTMRPMAVSDPCEFLLHSLGDLQSLYPCFHTDILLKLVSSFSLLCAGEGNSVALENFKTCKWQEDL